uniref:Sister chromatid cohesion 1 protein 3-like isoform X2 n=1 Tax=Nicotiana sylvestris TaxID=4096 RepID=A0A1U7VE09_NICSY|nr:PREDICTED: sister chromatid cohesion 1 protein 3-like isoform X2 [Nicotiana sylvestris]
MLLIDEDDIVLSNDKIGRLLNDTSALKRRRKNAPLSSLDIWKLNKRHTKDGMLFEPLITGVHNDICNIYKEDFISAKIKTASSLEDHVEPSGNHSPLPGNDLGIETERLRDNQEFACTNLLSEIFPSPNKFISSPQMPTPDPAASTGCVCSDMETPSTWYGDGLDVENTILSDIPEFDNSAGDLSFLDQDDRTPVGTPEVGYLLSNEGGTPEFDTLSARTRCWRIVDLSMQIKMNLMVI